MMKHGICLVLEALLCLTASAQDAEVFAATDWHWQDLGHGARYGSAQVPLFGSVQSISVLRYKARRFRTDIVSAPGTLADSTEALARRYKAVAAVNGSYFNMKTLYPVTFILDEKQLCGNTTPSELSRTDGLLTVRGRKVGIVRCDTTDYAAVTRRCRDAVAAGPVLILDGREARSEWPSTGFFQKRHPRTFIGTTADGWVYLVVIDGRFPGQGDGATIPETVRIARLFGLQDAINLDGGGSSVLWTRDAGAVSHPCDNRRYDHAGQRTVPNIILIRPR